MTTNNAKGEKVVADKTSDDNAGADSASGFGTERMLGSFYRAGQTALRSLKELPLAPIGVGATSLGLLLLYWYFWSIGYVPAEFGAVATLAGIAFAMVVVYVAWVGLALVGPYVLYQRSLSPFASVETAEDCPQSVRAFDWHLLGLQVGGVGFSICAMAAVQTARCSPHASFWWKVGLPLFAALLLACVSLMKQPHNRRSRWSTLSNCLITAGFSTIAVSVFFDLFLSPPGAGSWLQVTAMAVVPLVLFVANAWAVSRIPALVWGVALSFMLPALLYFLPDLAGHKNYLPRKIANLAGISDAKPSLLLVDASTCQLVASAVNLNPDASGTYACEEGKPWQPIHVHVLSTVGSKWLLDVLPPVGNSAMASTPSNANSQQPLARVSVSASSVQRIEVHEAPVSHCPISQ
ncbi:hypothetical protein [Hydrogenophaga sp. 5NK40-0174]|uniref:hypothetical protein n=1 Tax=Hydrogenophaga sp. 5NK40-0174 TaxID=3127649 RepID=UPI0031024075